MDISCHHIGDLKKAELLDADGVEIKSWTEHSGLLTVAVLRRPSDSALFIRARAAGRNARHATRYRLWCGHVGKANGTLVFVDARSAIWRIEHDGAYTVEAAGISMEVSF